ncbi:hypothetical protein BT63DRAFT_430325 [Microthyrium microscopicum]|uniref:HAUS augmin-like complex subunit 1 n=1 Tax=Microthyrium microscopicum TaxID=703497 RepID=A0A6A6TUQ1_9PEZI|nr:hypothetical protein BT63DRAFT_430325 [Microthyrium microscopicum]
MESGSLDLLPTALFSPSKAAQVRAQAQEWHQVDSWLSAKYQGRSVPQFERNEDTLKALLALSSANEKADEERDLLWNVQREALNEAKASKEQDATMMSAVESALDIDGKEALEVLADVATKLDAPKTDTYSIAETLCDRTQTSQILSQQLIHLTQLQKTLEAELTSLRAKLQELRSPAFQPPLSLQRQTLEWSRNTKQLRAKLGEYSDRLASAQSNQKESDATNVHDLVAKEEEIVQLEDQIALLASKVQAYQGLPQDTDQAVQKVKNVEQEASQLQRKLDSLFENLVVNK